VASCILLRRASRSGASGLIAKNKSSTMECCPHWRRRNPRRHRERRRDADRHSPLGTDNADGMQTEIPAWAPSTQTGRRRTKKRLDADKGISALKFKGLAAQTATQTVRFCLRC
jgi:hypothetical protein